MANDFTIDIQETAEFDVDPADNLPTFKEIKINPAIILDMVKKYKLPVSPLKKAENGQNLDFKPLKHEETENEKGQQYE